MELLARNTSLSVAEFKVMGILRLSLQSSWELLYDYFPFILHLRASEH